MRKKNITSKYSSERDRNPPLKFREENIWYSFEKYSQY